MFRLYRCTSALLVLLAALSLALPAYAADPSRKLSPRYRHWLDEEVNYLISSDEKKQFLALANDSERDHFIEVFWNIRNPDPNSETNSYKDEHYRRLAYVNQTFGSLTHDDGWRTDQGRIYITLGPPKQRAEYTMALNLRPISIWFYETTTPALPSFFYVLFYKRSPAEPYRLYSPYSDGPVRLITTLENMNDQKKSIDIIRKSVGDEVARTTLSLIPSEPVDFNSYAPSLESDVLLSTIEGLPDNPVTKELLAVRRSREHVTSSVFLGENQAELQTIVFREPEDKTTLHYLLRFRQPDASVIGKLPDGKLGYSFTLRAVVQTLKGEPVFEEENQLHGEVSEAQADIGRHKCFAAEGRLPLAPGDYRLDITLTNNLTRAAVRQQRSVTIPGSSKITSLRMTDLLAFAPQSPVRIQSAAIPFSISGLRFVPRGIQSVTLHSGDSLRILYQLWSPSGSFPAGNDQKVRVHYVYGRVQAESIPPHEEDEDVDANNFDPSGTLLTGHTFSTRGLTPGAYRLVATAVDPHTGQHTYASMVLTILGESETSEIWTAYDAELANAHSAATDDYKRGLSADASGDKKLAENLFLKALTSDQKYEPALEHLVRTYSETGQYRRIVDLTNSYSTPATLDSNSVLLIANADIMSGDPKRAVKWLENELQTHPPTASLYLELSEAWQKIGDNSKAQEYKRQAAKLQSN